METESNLTLYDANHRVIGQIPEISENDPITQEHLERILYYFTTFKLPEGAIILEKLRELSKWYLSSFTFFSFYKFYFDK